MTPLPVRLNEQAQYVVTIGGREYPVNYALRTTGEQLQMAENLRLVCDAEGISDDDTKEATCSRG